MAKEHGKKTHLSIDNSGGTPVDLSQYFDQVDFPMDVAVSETTGFQPTGDARTRLPGLKDAQFSGGGKYDTVSDAQLFSILGTEVTIIYGPQGNAAGKPKYSGEFIITKYAPPVTFDDVGTFSVEGMPNGPITRSTF